MMKQISTESKFLAFCMLDVVEKCFPEKIKSEDWQEKIKEMIPTYGQSLLDNRELCLATRERTTRILKLESEEV